MTGIAATTNLIKEEYWPLIKSRQTFLLTLTGAAGYLFRVSSPIDWPLFLGLVVSLLLTISGCTVFNMLLDRDIDRKMVRTRQRPLAAGKVSPGSAVRLGSVLVGAGLIIAAAISRRYFVVILAGIGLNVLVYTLWLKRRSAWSILWGGLAGGMPILAGSVLAVGGVDVLGALLALVIVFWIPSHNLTLSMLHSADYLDAGIPTFLSSYGTRAVNFMLTVCSLLVAFLVVTISSRLGFSMPAMAIILAGSLAYVGLGVLSWANPSPKMMGVLYKYSSLYMLLTMLMLSISGLIG